MNMKLSLSLLFVASTVVLQAQAPPVGVSSWTFSGEVQGVTWNEDCTFTVDAARKLTGSCKVQGLTTDNPVTGVVDGTTITFSHASEYEGTPLTLAFKGKIAADGTVSGDVDVSPNALSGAFTGKQKAAVAK